MTLNPCSSGILPCPRITIHEPAFIHGTGDSTHGFLHAGQTPYQLSPLALRYSVRAGSRTHHRFSGVWHREQACAVSAQGKQSWLCSWKVNSFGQKSDSYTPRTDRDRTSWGGGGLQLSVKRSGLCKAVISPIPHKDAEPCLLMKSSDQ